MESVEVIIETESKISQQTSQDIDNQKSSADPMDLAYQQQQDRFLQTLAKSAQLDTKESIEIKKLKAAIREDKPLSREAKTVKAPVVKKVVAAPVQDATQNIQPSIKKAKTYQPQAQIVAVKMQLPGSNNTRTSETISNRIESTAKSSLPQLTKGELNKIVSQFAHSYNKGDINRLMALFADNATTNDQTSKLGIKADYAELFNSTEHRNLMIKEGAADFVVTVQPKNSVERNLYRGYIKITAIKQYKDVYITRLIHELK